MDYQTALDDAAARWRDGDAPGALKRLTDLSVSNPHDIRSYLEAGQIEAALGNLLEAETWYNRACVVSDRNFWPYYLKAKLKESQHDYASCMECLTIASRQCKNSVSDEEYTNILKYLSDVKSIVLGPSPVQLQSLLRQKNVSGKALENAVRVSLVKDEEDIIYASLLSSYENGIRFYAIADNLSTDNTAAEIDRFIGDHPDCIVYVVRDPVVGYYQSAKTMGLTRLAVTMLEGAGKTIDWIFALDADELLHVTNHERDLHALLSSEEMQNSQMLAYWLCHASNSTILERVATDDDLSTTFDTFSIHHKSPTRKVAFRNNPNALIEQGNHYCRGVASDPSQITIGSQHGVLLKHYPIRSIEQLRKKILNGGKALKALTVNVGGAHWKHDYDRLMARGDAYVVEKLKSYHRTNADQADGFG